MSDTPEAPLLSPDDQRKADLRLRMAKGQEKMRELRAAGWKPVLLNPVEAAKAAPGSVKKAVKAYCWTCVGAGADTGAKFRVRDCTLGEKCALWPHRPWQTIKGGIVYNEDGEQVATPDSENIDEGSDE